MTYNLNSKKGLIIKPEKRLVLNSKKGLVYPQSTIIYIEEH